MPLSGGLCHSGRHDPVQTLQANVSVPRRHPSQSGDLGSGSRTDGAHAIRQLLGLQHKGAESDAIVADPHVIGPLDDGATLVCAFTTEAAPNVVTFEAEVHDVTPIAAA